MWYNDPKMVKIINRLQSFFGISIIKSKHGWGKGSEIEILFYYICQDGSRGQTAITLSEDMYFYIVKRSIEPEIMNFNVFTTPTPSNIVLWLSAMYYKGNIENESNNAQDEDIFGNSKKKESNEGEANWENADKYRSNKNQQNKEEERKRQQERARDNSFFNTFYRNANRETEFDAEEFIKGFFETFGKKSEGNNRRSQGSQKSNTPPNSNDSDFFKSRNNNLSSSVYFAELKVSVGSNESTVKKAYYNLVKEWHPDINKHREEEAKVKMARINQAYSMLKQRKFK